MQFFIKQIVKEHVTNEQHIIKDEELQFALIGADVEKLDDRSKFVVEKFESALTRRRSRVTADLNAKSY